MRIIEEHGYVPNTIAASLRIARTRTIGFLVPDIANPFFPEVLRGIREVCSRYDYNLILGNTSEDQAAERGVIRNLLEKRVDGLLLILADGSGESVRSACRGPSFGVPAVLIDRHVPGLDYDCVLIDNAGGASQATNHLLELGHRKVAVIHGHKDVTPGHERLKGYLDALAGRSVEVHPDYVREGDFMLQSGYEQTCRLLDLPDPPTAIFGGNNLMTIGAFRALKDRGIDVPGRMSLVGFDDFLLAGYLVPSVTVVERPTVDMGIIATELLLGRMEAKDSTISKKVVLPTRLTVRASSAPPPAG